MKSRAVFAWAVAAILLNGCTTTQVWRLDREYPDDPTASQSAVMEQKIVEALRIISPDFYRHVLTGSRLTIQISAGGAETANALVPLSLCYNPQLCERIYPRSPPRAQTDQ